MTESCEEKGNLCYEAGKSATCSYSPGNSRKRDENNLAKWLGFPHLQDTLDGPGRPKSLPQIGLSSLKCDAADAQGHSALEARKLSRSERR